MPSQESNSSKFSWHTPQYSDSDDYEMSTSETSNETIYLSDVDLSSEDDGIVASGSIPGVDQDEINQQNEINQDESDEEEEEEERRQQRREARAQIRHRRRVCQAIHDWMEIIYVSRLEEEATYIKNHPKNINWSDQRLLTFRMLCKDDISNTQRQLQEGDILCPLSETTLEE